MFTVKIGEFRIVPRPRYLYYDEEITVNLNSDDSSQSGCTSGADGACGSPIKNREIVFKVRCPGHGDLRAADISYRALETFLAEICRSNQQDWFRQISNEDPLIYPIASGYIRPIDMDLEFSCEAVKTGEVHLFTAEESGAVEIAMFNYNILKPI